MALTSAGHPALSDTHQGPTPGPATHRSSQQFIQQRPEAPPVTGFRELGNPAHLCGSKHTHTCPNLVREEGLPFIQSPRRAGQRLWGPAPPRPPPQLPLAWGAVEAIHSLPAAVGLHLGPLAEIREPDVTLTVRAGGMEWGQKFRSVVGQLALGRGLQDFPR